MPTFLSPLVKDPSAPKILLNKRTKGVLASRLIPAFESKSRTVGLLRHTSLPAGDAMIIAPCDAIHTFFMRFPIDVVFVAKNGRVLKTRAAVKAWRIAFAFRAYATVEMAAGTLLGCPIVVGDYLEVCDPT
jgi:uncharacterized membrane protein (UPF0127 family)